MTRSKWKGSFLSNSILNKKLQVNTTDTILNIWARNSMIPEFLCGKMVSVHNGKEFIPFFVDRKKIGFKFGEFSLTKKHSKWEKKKKGKK